MCIAPNADIPLQYPTTGVLTKEKAKCALVELAAQNNDKWISVVILDRGDVPFWSSGNGYGTRRLLR